MAIPQRQVTGQVLAPTGVGISGGQIDVELSTPGTVDDDTTADVYSILGRQTVQIDGSGNVDFNLVPNDLITPANTNYKFTYRLPDGSIIGERIQIVDGVGAVYIGDLTRVSSGETLIGTGVTVSATLPTASSYYENKILVVKVNGQRSRAYICLSNGGVGGSTIYSWEEIAFGSGGL